MFVVNTFPQLEEAVRVGANEILVHGRLAVFVRHNLEGMAQRTKLAVGEVEYDAVTEQSGEHLAQLLLCRSQK